MQDTYTDENGYLRHNATQMLVHRQNYFATNPNGIRTWHVHHIDGKKKNNDTSNLILLKPEVHAELHRRWSLNNLPSRQQIECWLQGDALSELTKKRKRKKRKTRGRASLEDRAVWRSLSPRKKKWGMDSMSIVTDYFEREKKKIEQARRLAPKVILRKANPC